MALVFLVRVAHRGPFLPLRDLLPLGYLLLSYWLPAHLVTRFNEAAERALLTFDDRVLGGDRLAFATRAPRVFVELLELAYLFCYPLMPLGFACLYVAGFAADADRFWTAVLLAGFLCYGVLPWLATRPPRTIEHEPAAHRSSIRTINLWVLGFGSVQFNTFPSGHVATSLATALVVATRLPRTGVVLGLIAIGIAVGSVVGRYHYAADAVAGAIVAVIAFTFALAFV
jgi:membrane-associated phospholipid phosphatase